MDKIYSRKRLLLHKARLNKNRSDGQFGNLKNDSNSNYGNSFNNYNSGNCNINSSNSSSNAKYIKNFNKNELNNKIKNSKTIKTAIVVIIAVFMANKIISAVEPTMNLMCIDMAKSIATRVSNEQATAIMRKI